MIALVLVLVLVLVILNLYFLGAQGKNSFLLYNINSPLIFQSHSSPQIMIVVVVVVVVVAQMINVNN